MTILLGRHSDDYAIIKVLYTLKDTGAIYSLEKINDANFNPKNTGRSL